MKAARDNITVGSDLGSLMGLISPTTVVQQLMGHHSAAEVFHRPNTSVVNQACYRDVIDTLDSVVAFKKWAIDSKGGKILFNF